MKIWDICKKENLGKKYKLLYDTTTWTVLYTDVFDSSVTLKDVNNNDIKTMYGLSELLDFDFEEVVDWSKVAVDTKILVSNCINGAGEVIEWRKRYFAKYENGKIYAWNDGVTSFSVDSDDLCTRWDFVKLYKEEK